METKICRVCHIEKPLTLFYKRKDSLDGYRNECIDCRKKQDSIYYANNKEKKNIASSNFYKNNRENELIRRRENYIKNKEHYNELSKQYYQNHKEEIYLYQKEYRKNNRKIINLKLQEKRKNNPNIKFKKKISDMIYNCIKNRCGYDKKNRTEEILGCDILYFKDYISSKFQNGMCWENYGLWHLDHIIPISQATTYEETIKLNHYSNFQPLWAKENREKGKKVIV